MSAVLTAARHLHDYVVELQFDDGASGVVDLRRHVSGRRGLLGELTQVDLFRQLAVDAEAGTLCWPNGADLCPDVLYHEVTGAPLPGEASAPRRAV